MNQCECKHSIENLWTNPCYYCSLEQKLEAQQKQIEHYDESTGHRIDLLVNRIKDLEKQRDIGVERIKKLEEKYNIILKLQSDKHDSIENIYDRLEYVESKLAEHEIKFQKTHDKFKDITSDLDENRRSWDRAKN